MRVKKRPSESSKDSLLDIILFRYLPYWPLFAILSTLFLLLAFVATRYITPAYRVSAKLVINDKAKGTEESETLRSLNVYAGDKIVENEILVLTSRSLVRDVVLGLDLHAPVFEEGGFKPSSAYLTSPILVEVQEPADIVEQEEIGFSYDYEKELVNLGNKEYPLGEWIEFPYATLRFQKNPNQIAPSQEPLYFSLIDPRKVTFAILDNLEVGATSKLSSVINVVFTDVVPERGEDIVNALLRAYMNASVSHNSQLAANTLSFISERLDDVESDLDSINRRVQQFRSSRGVIDLSEQGRLYLQSVAETDRRLSDVNMQLAVLNQVEQFVNSGVAKTGIVPTTLGIQDPVLAELIQTLNELQLRYAGLIATTGVNNPIVETVENEIQEIRPNILDIVLDQRARLQASRNTLSSISDNFNSQINEIPEQERELLEISRQQAIKNDVYAFLLQRKEEAELSAASTIPDGRIVDWAEASFSPVSSKKLLFLIGALIGAFALAIAYIFLKEGLSNRILFRSVIERATSIPVLAEIKHSKWLERVRSGLASDLVLSATFKQLQAALGLFNPGNPKHKILVTSNFENEGKTLVSNQLALSLASAGQKVLLVDLNLYTSESSALHNVQSASGFSDLVTGKSGLEAVIRHTDYEGLYILPAGTKAENPTALLWNERVPHLFKELEQQFDFVVVDSPPIELTTDAYLISKFCDISLLVIRQGHTPGSILQKLEGNIKLEAMPGLGIVFNDVSARGFMSKFYGYGYGYGHESVAKSRSYSTLE